MTRNIKFSVLVPAFKATFLKECVESVLEQTYTNWELIIINDCSPENLDEIINQLHDSRITYLKNEINTGAKNVINNWNKCLSFATGNYTICMGDDDKLLPDCMAGYRELIEEYPNYDIYHAWTEIIDEKSDVIAMQEPRPLKESAYSMLYHRWHGRKQFIGDFLFATDKLKSMGGFYFMPMAWWSDDITACMMAKEKGVINSQKPLFLYRVNNRTLSSTGNTQEKLEASRLFEQWVNDFLNSEPTSNIDRIWQRNLLDEKAYFFLKEKLYKISEDILFNGYKKIFYWIKRHNEYKLSAKDFLFIVYDVIKRKSRDKI